MKLRSLFVLALPACSPMPKLSFNEPPVAPRVHIEPAAPTTLDRLVATLDEEAVDPDGDEIAYVYTWTRDGETYMGNTPHVEASATSEHEVWVLSAVADDGEWQSEPVTSTVTILNSAPEMTGLTISPANPLTTEDLTLHPTGDDPDEETVSFLVDWSIDGVLAPSFQNLLTIPSASTDSGELWSASVSPYDGTDRGAPLTVDVFIDNTTPTIASVSLVPGDPQVLDSLQATAVGLTDPDRQTPTVDFVWYVDGVQVEQDNRTNGIATLSGLFAKGDAVVATAIANDGFADSALVSSAAVTVLNTAPVLDDLSLSPASGDESTTFTCTLGTAHDDDGDRILYDYDWYVDGTLLSASDSTLTGTSFARDQDIYCVATPSDEEDDGLPVTSDTVTILNSVPYLGTVVLSPVSPSVATSVGTTLAGTGDADGDSITYSYYWEVNGVHTGGATSTLSNSNFVRGDVIEVTVTPSDSSGSGTAVTSGPVTVVNALPTLTSVSVTPTSPYADDALTAQPSGWNDYDGDSAAYLYQWYRSSVALSGQTSRTLAETFLSRGDRIYCAVTPDDGYGYGTVVNSPIITVLNSAPVASVSVITGVTATECDDVQLSATASLDADADVLTYAWTLASKPSASMRTTSDIDATTDAAPFFQVDGAGTFTFSVSVSDASATDTDTISVTVYDRAGNTDPVASAGTDQASSGYATCTYNGYTWTCPPCLGDTFALVATGSYDDEGDELSYVWSTSASYSSIASSTSESTTLSLASLPAEYGVTNTYTASVRLRAVDCAGGSNEDYVTMTFECTGI